MNQWNKVKKQDDIEMLMKAYGGFHDSCIKELNYVSGASVDDKKNMYFGAPNDRELHIIFQRQWDPITIELCFSGLRRMNLVGWESNYFCDIFDSYLSFDNDLITGLDDNLIVWADNANFDVKNVAGGSAIKEPMTSFVIANELKWRFISE
ncbi:UNVERIFIED_CONTAM: hypothetical protein Cloal_1887 [Acetivibrio alkalicellulosi]